MTIQTFKSDETRIHLREILDRVVAGNQVVIERYNKPIGVMIPYAEWKAQQIANGLEEAKRAIERIDRGESGVTSLEEVKALVLAKRNGGAVHHEAG